MSENIKVTINGQRGIPPVLTTIATGINFQLDNMAQVEAVGYNQAEPHNVFDGYTTDLPVTNSQLLLEGDVLVDAVVDPYTSLGRRYRVVTVPEPYPDQHWEVVLFRYVGK